MDSETKHFLKTLHPSRKTMNKMYKQEAPLKADKEKMIEVMNSRVTSDRDKKLIKNALDMGGDRYDQKKMVINEKVALEEEKRVETKIKDAIKRGDIKPFDPRQDKQAQQWIDKAQR